MREKLRNIVTICCNELSITEAQYYSASRKREYVDARHISKKICSEFETNKSAVARYLDSDESTVWHSISMYDELYSVNPLFRKKADDCRLAVKKSLDIKHPLNPYNSLIMLIAMIDGNHSIEDLKPQVQACKNSLNFLTGSKIY